TTTATAFGTVKRSVNNAERGAEILTSQNSSFAAQNLSGSAFATNFDLCNAEGGDKQCIDWNANNNFYTTVYECIADWEAPSGTGINLQYYKGTTPQSIGMSKVTAAGKTALIGWRYSANRFVSCGSTTDLNPGCNGYSFLSGSLPTQFSRAFYALATNNLGQAWSFYGATSCSHYFNGPFFSPIAIPDTSVTGVITCSSGDSFFTGDVDYCSTSAGFTGTPSLSIVGPNGFNETISAGSVGTTPIVDAGDYTITASVPTTPTQCLDCGKSICVPISAAQIASCTALPIDLFNFYLENLTNRIVINWQTLSEHNSAYFEVQKSVDAIGFEAIGSIDAAGNSSDLLTYSFVDDEKNELVYYRLKQVDFDGKFAYSQILSLENATKTVFYPNPSNGSINVSIANDNSTVSIVNSMGTIVYQVAFSEKGNYLIDLKHHAKGVYWLEVISNEDTHIEQLILSENN
ncbi:MAG: T9SS type A sorting domain-containing protein, partial [Crocinitomicaceae bacterium]